MTRRAVILGTGSALPARRVSNEELSKTVETSDDWIVERTGIRFRYIAGDGETTATLGAEAARKALDAAGLEFVRIPGDGACAYWAALLTVGRIPRTFFAGGRRPFDGREPADEAALDLMRALRLAVVSWLVAPEQRALLRSETGITLSFEEYVRGCS